MLVPPKVYVYFCMVLNLSFESATLTLFKLSIESNRIILNLILCYRCQN